MITFVNWIMIYLITLEPVQKCDANDSSFNASVVSESGERDGLHFDIDHSLAADVVEVLHLIGLGVLAEGTVQSSLSCFRNNLLL